MGEPLITASCSQRNDRPPESVLPAEVPAANLSAARSRGERWKSWTGTRGASMARCYSRSRLFRTPRAGHRTPAEQFCYTIRMDRDAEQLRRLGYAQELLRDMGGFANFALSFSI